MKILMEEHSYEGSAQDIIEKMKQESLFGGEYPDTVAYLEYMRETFVRMTGISCHLTGPVEGRAQDMLAALASIDAITVLEE